MLRALLPKVILITESMGLALLAVVRHGAARTALEAGDISDMGYDNDS